MNSITMIEPAELVEQPRSAVAPAIPTSALSVVTPAQLVARALEQGASVEVLERLMALQVQQEQINADREKREVEREQRDAVKAFNAAFAAFRGEDLRVLKDKCRTSGPLSGQKYASLHGFVKATKDALSRHGLGVRWDVTKDEPDWIEVTCILKHSQGHFETVSMGGPPDAGPARNVLQARHSTVSYLERYTLKAICGLAEEEDDDDGNGGSQSASAETALMDEGRSAAMEGVKSLTDWWGKLTAKQRSAMNKEFGALRKAAEQADRSVRHG